MLNSQPTLSKNRKLYNDHVRFLNPLLRKLVKTLTIMLSFNEKFKFTSDVTQKTWYQQLFEFYGKEIDQLKYQLIKTQKIYSTLISRYPNSPSSFPSIDIFQT